MTQLLSCYFTSLALGRGPLQSYYAKLIKEQKWKHVEVIMLWLEWSDYPVFLGCADLGLSIHRSSSGLDLPMKVSLKYFQILQRSSMCNLKMSPYVICNHEVGLLPK